MNALPMLCMFVVMIAVPVVISYALDIPWNAPLDMAPWGWWLAVILLAGMVLGIGTGWLLGILLNVLAANLLHGWALRKGIRVFWFKEVPNDWRLAEWRGDNSFGLREAQRQWDEQRRKGVVRGIIRKGLPWGLTMFVAVGLFPILSNPSAYDWGDVAFRALIWTVAGGLFGWWMWLMDRRPE
ncbi:hypothetical protein IP84_02030 [beta proteobacterium AAP99]|nr:hypothetical protein IP84_02030 [beta proteobacterium AAP99]